MHRIEPAPTMPASSSATASPFFQRHRLATVVTASSALVLVVAVLAVTGLHSAAAADKPAASAPRPALTVTTALPQQGEGVVTLSANGSIAAWQEAIIGSEASGLRLNAVKANVGDVVRAGQVLATFSADTVKAELAQARASVLEAEATAADAAANAKRARTLEKSGALSAVQIATYATGEQTAQARVEAARAAFQAQKVRLGFAEVRAPDSGVISSRSATVGAVVGAGTELFRMVRKGRLEWRAEVTSSEIGRIHAGMPVRVTAAGGSTLQGTVRTVAPTVDPQTRNGIVYVDLPAQPGYGMPAVSSSAARGAHASGRTAEPPQGGRASPSGGGDHTTVGSRGALFLPGMFAHGEFVLGKSNALTVPQQAVVVRDAFSYVFVVGTDGHVAQRKVQTGRHLGDRVEITSGLDAATPVVVQGAGFLNDRDLVRVVQAAAPATQAGAPGTSASNQPVAHSDQARPATK
jgi:HlyD family secretion protein